MTKQYANYADLITFSRASGGTALRPISYGDEIVTNGDFSDGATGWQSDGTNWSISGGVASSDGSGDGWIFQGGAQEVGKVYLVEFEIVTVSAGDVAVSNGYGQTLGESFGTVGVHRSVFYAESITFALRAINLFTGTIDNISVKEVLFDQPGAPLTLFNHPAGIPRVEFDADRNVLGLLVEESRTNLVTYSEDFEQWLAFNYGGANLAIDYGYASPDGSNNASKLTYTEGSGSNGSLLSSNITATASLDYSLSIWMKGQVGGEKVRVDFRNNASSGIAGDIITLTSEWKKYSVTVTNNTGTTRGFQFRLTSLDSIVSQTFYIYGAQLEQGSFPTSYIPTSGSTVTRAADVASIPVADFGYNQSEGTLVVDFKTFNTTTNNSVVSIGANSSNAWGIYSINAYQLRNLVGGSSNVLLDNGTVSETNKISSGYKTDDFAVSLNGNTASTDTSGSVQTAPSTTMHIGIFVSTNQFNGHIKSIQYYPRRLSNAQLQELTS